MSVGGLVMEVFVAKQPVYNIKEEIVGYELLYRKDSTNVFPIIDGDQATSELIINSYLNIGLGKLTKGKRYCIHFTENLLEQRLPTFFDPETLVVKLARNVKVSDKIITICKELKDLGYTIVIHEEIFQSEYPGFNEILPYIDMMEVDLKIGKQEYLELIEEMATNYHIQLLAEKIETKEDFEKAKKRGYHLFQGYYFSKPIMESTYEIPTTFSTLYQSIENGEMDALPIDELVEVIEKDLSLSVKLLRLINNEQIEVDQKICSIRDAIVHLGKKEIKKWIHFLLARKSKEKQTKLSYDLTRLSLTRAKFCERIAKETGTYDTSGYYMTGLISTLEEIGCTSKKELLSDLPISGEIMDALMGKDNEFKQILDLVSAVENAKWKEISEICKTINVTERDLFRIYAESLNWSTEMIKEETAEDKETLILQ